MSDRPCFPLEVWKKVAHAIDLSGFCRSSGGLQPCAVPYGRRLRRRV